MKKVAILCLIQIIAFQLYADDRDVRHPGQFNAIHVGGGIDLVIYQNDEYRVEVESGRDTDDIITEVSGDVLKVHYRDGWNFFNWRTRDKVYVYTPDVEEIKCSGGSDVEGGEKISGDYLLLESSGGSDIKMDVDVRELVLESSGGSDIVLTGFARFLKAESSGGSDIKAFDLVAEEAELHSSGGSDIQITVEERISARASGGSDIYYRGDPKYVNIDSSSGGDVHHQ